MTRARGERKKPAKPIEVRELEPLGPIEPWELDLVRERLLTSVDFRVGESEVSHGR